MTSRDATTPLGALARGIVAGAAGSLALSAFFRLSRGITPETRPGTFDPPEPRRGGESATQALARRWVEDLMKRGPMSDEAIERAGTLVHYAFGAGWGGLYGLAAESAPGLRSAAGAAAFGSAVWMVSQNLLLPAFRLAPWPHRSSARSHAYAWAAHLVYGAAVVTASRGMQRLVDRALTPQPQELGPEPILRETEEILLASA